MGHYSTIGNRYFANCSATDIQPYNLHFAGFSAEMEQILPLETLSWDIEVSTRTGKFDDNGHDEENRIICICYTLESPCMLGVPRRSVCIVTEDCGQRSMIGE